MIAKEISKIIKKNEIDWKGIYYTENEEKEHNIRKGMNFIIQKLKEMPKMDVDNEEAEYIRNLLPHKDSIRIDKIYKHIRGHFQEEQIPLSDVAALVNMTVPAFCRFFKKNTGKTFTQFVNEFRIVHATKLLHETDDPISAICYDCGFNNFSHFNRHFKKITGKSPREYRKELNPVPLV